jgi:hypothetical protein
MQVRQLWGVLTASVLLGACAGTPGRDTTLRLDVPNTVTSTCRQQPASCVNVPGAPQLPPLSGAAQTAASAGMTGQVVLRVLEATEKTLVEQVLTECADMARSDILLRRLGDRSPTPAECNEVVERDSRGAPVTRAMLLGREMHQEALQCTEEKLGEVLPDRFSLEPCYRYDAQTGRTTLISSGEKQALLRQGRSCELVGTISPDVVIHTGNPLEAQAVYDFKFPCVNSDRTPQWNTYPPGHPHAGRQQGTVYRDALNTNVSRVVPRLGVIP